MKPETYNKSRLSILSYVLTFSTKRFYGDENRYSVNADEGWHGGYSMTQEPPIGSLCMLLAAPDSKWYLGWLLETREGGMGKEYLLKSIEDGQNCWWSNVAICFFPKANEFPSWKWTDRQHDFKERWMRACRRKSDYWTKPLYPVFNPDGSVILGTREHVIAAVEGNDYRPTKKFDNWKKVKSKEMQEFYEYACNSKPKKVKDESK